MDPDCIKSRKEVINLLAKAGSRGRLGLFVGTGFSKAATKGQAPTFVELLKVVATSLSLNSDFTEERFHLKSLPQIATILMEILKEERGISKEQAGALFRQEIANKCNLIPEKEPRERLGAILVRAKASWIVTTNYDLILESLIERSETILPPEVLFPNQDRVPIYHLHGHRYYLDSIKITEEDYVGLLAPLDYQRLKLPLLFAESTSLMLGYALGDINVRAAIEWSKSFMPTSGNLDLGGQVIQALYKETPTGDPYYGEHGEIILETKDVFELLAEIGDARETIETSFRLLEDKIQEFLSDEKNALAIKDEGPERESILNIVEASSKVGSISAIIQFLEKAMEPIWVKALEYGGFKYYDAYLEMIMFLMGKWKKNQFSPNLISFVARALNRVGLYFDEGYGYGTAHEATRRWLRNAPGLDKELLDELKSFGEVNCLTSLVKLMGASTLKK